MAIPYKTVSQYNSEQQNLPFLLLLKMLQQGQDAQTAARSANEQRRNEILDRDVDTRNRLLDYVGQYGKSQLNDIKTADRQLRGRDTAALAAAGFLGASPDMMRGADITATRAYLENLANVQDHLLQNAINVDERTSNRLSDFQERITDEYPKDNTALLGQLGELGGLGNLLPGGGGAYGTSNQNVASSGPKAATPTKYALARAPVVQTPKFNEAAAMQQDSAEQAANAPQPVPWNYGNPYGNYDGAAKQYIPAPGGGMQSARDTMPALGVFGAGTQMHNVGNGASYTFPYQASAGSGYRRTPLRSRDPIFASILDKRGVGVAPFQIEGTASSTAMPPSPDIQGPSWLTSLAPILKTIGPYLSSVFGV